jgi:hypothetical protein
MTERKPAETGFASWIDQQIAEAEKRGAFDNLPGAGKPIPHREDAFQAWLQDYLRREGVSAKELLPTPLRLRKEIEELADGVHDMRSEQEVREAVRELNRRIMDWRRTPVGPPVLVPLADEDRLIGEWRERQAPKPATPARGEPDPVGRRPGRWRRR